MSQDVIVRMGDLAVTRSPDTVLVGLGLGSCIGLCGYDPVSRVAAMAHVVLPETVGNPSAEPGKYADSAVSNLVQAMVKAGATRHTIRTAIAGGARLFQFQTSNSVMDIGTRNIKAITEILGSMGIPPQGMDVGGCSGRTVKLRVSDGIVTVRQAGKPETVLAELAGVLQMAA